MLEDRHESNTGNLLSKSPRWVIVVCCLVGSAIIPLLVALSPQLTKLTESAIQSQIARDDNEKTALGAILNLTAINTKQIVILSEALDEEQKAGREAFIRITQLEKDGKDCAQNLGVCEQKMKRFQR